MAKHAARRQHAASPSPESIEGFARRMVRLFSGRFESELPAVQISGLRHCLEMILTVLHSDVGPLHAFDSLDEVPTPTSPMRTKPQDSGLLVAASPGSSSPAKRSVS